MITKTYFPNSEALGKALAMQDYEWTEETHLEGPSSEVSGLLMKVGNVFMENSEFEDAYQVYEEALHLQQASETSADTVVATLALIAQAKQAVGDYDSAFQALSEVLELQTKEEDIADTLYASGLVLLEGGHHDDALQVLRQAIIVQQHIADERGIVDDGFIAMTLDYMGEVHLQLNQLDEAVNTWAESLNMWEQLNRKERMADTLNSIGVAYFRGGDLYGSLGIYEDAITAYRSIGAHDMANSQLAVALQNYEMVVKLIEEASTETQSCIVSYHLNGKINQTGEEHC